jgi:hypothetical protein
MSRARNGHGGNKTKSEKVRWCSFFRFFSFFVRCFFVRALFTKKCVRGRVCVCVCVCVRVIGSHPSEDVGKQTNNQDAHPSVIALTPTKKARTDAPQLTADESGGSGGSTAAAAAAVLTPATVCVFSANNWQQQLLQAIETNDGLLVQAIVSLDAWEPTPDELRTLAIEIATCNQSGPLLWHLVAAIEANHQLHLFPIYHVAICFKRMELLRALCARPIPSLDHTHLVTAAQVGDVEIMRFLLEQPQSHPMSSALLPILATSHSPIITLVMNHPHVHITKEVLETFLQQNNHEWLRKCVEEIHDQIKQVHATIQVPRRKAADLAGCHDLVQLAAGCERVDETSLQLLLECNLSNLLPAQADGYNRPLATALYRRHAEKVSLLLPRATKPIHDVLFHAISTGSNAMTRLVLASPRFDKDARLRANIKDQGIHLAIETHDAALLRSFLRLRGPSELVSSDANVSSLLNRMDRHHAWHLLPLLLQSQQVGNRLVRSATQGNKLVKVDACQQRVQVGPLSFPRWAWTAAFLFSSSSTSQTYVPCAATFSTVPAPLERTAARSATTNQPQIQTTASPAKAAETGDLLALELAVAHLTVGRTAVPMAAFYGPNACMHPFLKRILDTFHTMQEEDSLPDDVLISCVLPFVYGYEVE